MTTAASAASRRSGQSSGISTTRSRTPTTVSALGFAPLWSVLTNEQRTTPAFTSIFSFIAALKASRPGDATAINTLLFAQNINNVTDAFATGESNVPTSVSERRRAAAVFDRNHRWAGADAAQRGRRGHSTTRSAITASSASTSRARAPSPSAQARRTRIRPTPISWCTEMASIVAAGIDGATQNPEVESFTATAGTYIIDVYDCANGCGDRRHPGRLHPHRDDQLRPRSWRTENSR